MKNFEPFVYRYVGPESIRDHARQDVNCRRVKDKGSLLGWMEYYLTPGQRQLEIIATYIVDVAGDLWLADRCSEHVACANGRDVLAAGEMTFTLKRERNGWGLAVIDCSNQSTGYCPRPECWEAVEAALDDMGIYHPGRFTTSFDFRRCTHCLSIQLVKDDVFECIECGADLDREWNFTST